MFLEGELNGVLIMATATAVSLLVAVIAVWFAVANRVRHVSASDRLDVVQRVAEASDKRLFQTLNAIPVALVETDAQGKFVFANRAAHQLLGRRDAELIGLRFHSATWGVTFPDGRPVPPDLLPSARALRGQTVRGFQHLMANPSTRKKMLVSVTAMPIENERGEVIGSTAAIVETEGLTTPEAVAEPAAAAPAPVAAPDESFVRRVFEAASSALVVVDADGRVREANAVAADLLGAAEAPLDADFADRFLDLDHRVVARQALRAGLAAPAGEAEPIVGPTPGGQVVRWRLLPLPDADGGVAALLLAGERVTPEVEIAAVESQDVAEAVETPEATPEDSQELEALRAAVAAADDRAAQALAEAERLRAETRAELDAARRLESVGRVTGGVAQDVNALLGVLTSAIQMMLQQADDGARVRRLGQAALTAGERGEALTRRLTALADADESGSAQVLDLGVMLRAQEGRLRALAGPGVDLMIEAPSPEMLALVDPVAFDGVVWALTDNAVRAVGGEGSVAVRLEATAEGEIRLSVRDTGPGMDDDTRRRAAEPFFTTRHGAAGLGLSQAHAFARRSGGRLEIDSALGDGAEVAVVLPAAD